MLRVKANQGILWEWAVWMVLALIAYNITFVFDKPIEGYVYGATGWPRAILIAIMFGASLQLIFRFMRWEDSEPIETADADTGSGILARLPNFRTLAVFLLPLVYVWLMPRTGFYLTTPFLIVALMAALDVRGWRPFVIVTAVVYGLIMLIFTRLFYVALPVGNWQPFYDINNAIILVVRFGL